MIVYPAWVERQGAWPCDEDADLSGSRFRNSPPDEGIRWFARIQAGLTPPVTFAWLLPFQNETYVQYWQKKEEWELLCRLPWPEWRFARCVCEPWGEWLVSATDHPCVRDPHGFRTRYYLCDLARDAYTALRREGIDGGPPRLLGAR